MIDSLPDDVIGLYLEYFMQGGIRVPFSSFLLSIIRHYKVHISQLVPLDFNWTTLFEV